MRFERFERFEKLRRGFTLIEIMVATLLLVILVTILTMIFNQSSIAWSVGIASVTGLDRAREDISVYARESENAILSDDGNKVLQLTSLFDDANGGIRKNGDGRTLSMTMEKLNAAPSDMSDPIASRTYAVTGSGTAGHETFIVGVVSYGPYGKTGGDYSWDDISTMPEEIVK